MAAVVPTFDPDPRLLRPPGITRLLRRVRESSKPVWRRGGALLPTTRGEWAVALGAVALAARLPLFLVRHEATPGGDSLGYLTLGQELLRGEYSAIGEIRPPGYPVFIAILDLFPGRVEDAVVAAQLLIGVGVVVIVVLAGWTYFGRLTAILAGTLCAASPMMVHLEVAILADFLFGVLVLAGGLVLARALCVEDGRTRLLVLTGVVFGLATYVKPAGQFLLFAPPLALALSTRSWRLTLRGSALVACALLLTISPWLARNAIVYGQPSMSVQSGTTLFNRAFEQDRLPIPTDSADGRFLKRYLEDNPDERPSTGGFDALVEAGKTREEAFAIQQELAVTAFKRAPHRFVAGSAEGVHRFFSDAGNDKAAIEPLERGLEAGDPPLRWIPSVVWEASRPFTTLWYLLALHGLAGFLWLLVRSPQTRLAAAALLSVWLATSAGTAITHGGQFRYSVSLAPISWLLGAAGSAVAVSTLLIVFRERRHRTALLCTLAAGALAVGVLLSSLAISGSPLEARSLELGTDFPARGDTRSGTIQERSDGYLIDGQAAGRMSLPVPIAPSGDQGSALRLWAYGPPGVQTNVVLVRPDGSRRSLGRADRWVGRPFDLTDRDEGRRARLEVAVENSTAQPVLFLDRVLHVVIPPEARSSAGPLLTALCMALLVVAALAAARLLAHWPLAILLALASYVFWKRAADLTPVALDGEAPRLWSAAKEAGWIGLDRGLLSGSFDDLSPLTVQLFHALGPVVGSGSPAARSASALIGVAAFAAIYVLVNRIAGRVPATVAVAVALLAGPLREGASDGTAATTIVLAMALFLYGVHECLVRVSVRSAILLGIGSGLVALAEPMCLAGVLAAAPALLLLRCPPGQRLRVVGVALLVLAVVAGPNRLSTAVQNGGDPWADLTKRATQAQALERAAEGGLSPDAASGDEVGLVEYLFWDHSVGVVVGGALEGTVDAWGAALETSATPLGPVASLLMVAGLLYLLILPRLRWLLILPGLVSLPVLFLVGRDLTPAEAGGAVLWPAVFLAAGVVVSAVTRIWAERRRPELDAPSQTEDRASRRPERDLAPV